MKLKLSVCASSAARQTSCTISASLTSGIQKINLIPLNNFNSKTISAFGKTLLELRQKLRIESTSVPLTVFIIKTTHRSS